MKYLLNLVNLVKPIESPPKVRRSARSNKGIPLTRCGSITSHKVSENKETWNMA